MTANPDFCDVEVVSRDMLDEPTNPAWEKPWLVIWPSGAVTFYDTEDAACEEQRNWRLIYHRNPMTGEPMTEGA